MKRVASFSARLAELRRIKGWTLEEMGKAIDMNPQTLNRYELSQRIPKITDANAIADALRVNPLWLQGYDVDIDEPRPSNSEDAQTIPNQVLAAAAHLDTNDPEAIKEYYNMIAYLNSKYGKQK